MIDRVPDHVHQRIAELFHDQLVDFGLGAGDDQANFLVQLAADLPHHARQALEHLPERHHAHFQDAVLHLAQAPVEVAVQTHELGGELG